MSLAARLPDLRFTAVPRPPEPSPLRSDVAGFLGRTRRGPVGVPVRVEGWRGYLRQFGGLAAEAVTSYAVRGYFENGGEVAWVVRLAGGRGVAASAEWEIGTLSGRRWSAGSPGKGGFRAPRYRIEATSPGAWANGTTVVIRYRFQGPQGWPEVVLAVQAPGEPPETLPALEPADLDLPGAFASTLVRLVPLGEEPEAAGSPRGPREREWRLTLAGGSLSEPDRAAYLRAAERLGDEPEVALVAAPDLASDLADDGERREVLATLMERADELHDRLVLIDLPCGRLDPDAAVGWLAKLPEPPRRAAAAYHPWIAVEDPLGRLGSPLRAVPPSGSVAGLISRLDRERGAQHTPANAELADALDLSRAFAPAEAELLFAGKVNLLRCAPGRGLQVWGGRTLEPEPTGRYISHRRLVHRLVRALRRVAEPLVFDVEGPELWLAFVRSVTTVLLEAWRRGGLKGARPEEAFRVQCDEAINPPEERELGRVLCKIELAPAVPMEFIELRVALSADGGLEVLTP